MTKRPLGERLKARKAALLDTHDWINRTREQAMTGMGMELESRIRTEIRACFRIVIQNNVRLVVTS